MSKDCSHPNRWIPPERCDSCGHRVSPMTNYQPVQTRTLPWYCKITELPLRWLARRMATADVTARTQVERKRDDAQESSTRA